MGNISYCITFRSMDPKERGYLLEEDLRKLLKGKSGISAEDVEEMITEYKVCFFVDFSVF